MSCFSVADQHALASAESLQPCQRMCLLVQLLLKQARNVEMLKRRLRLYMVIGVGG